MLYRLLKFPAKLALWLYCRHIKINDTKILDSDGPLLIASNHPNSFLDAIILSTIFHKPIHSLARGDVFKTKFSNTVLRSMNMLPVYRASEGVENMEHNYTSFKDCKEIFKQNGIVLIFSEGRCLNEWHLRSLMKGTARLALSSWEDGIPLRVLPLGINYQSFSSFGKNLEINSGEIINQKEINTVEGFGKAIHSFNTVLQKRLQPLLHEIDRNDTQVLKEKMGLRISASKKILLAVPAAIGYIFHWPLYFFIQRFTWKKASENDHYDSVLVGLLFILYPVYLLLITAVLLFVTKCWYFLLFILAAPFCAWSFVQVKKQF